MNFNLTSEAEWKQQITDYIWQVLTGAFKPFQPIVDFFGNLWRYIDYALKFLGNLFSYVLMWIPFLLEIFGIFMIIFTLTCVVTGEVDRVVDLLYKIYQFFANLISMFINVAEAIYNKIKFW
jgi:phage-related protein